MSDDPWRPLSARHDPERAKEFQILHDGVPDWLLEPIQQWIERVLPSKPTLAELTAEVPTKWSSARLGMQAKLHAKMPVDGPERIAGDLCLDVVDYIIQFRSVVRQELSALEGALADGGSAWRATPRGLERRVDETLQVLGESTIATDSRPAHHLRSAWHRAWGRNPDASGAYRESVRAVEAAYAPIILPRDQTATLGKMIAALRDKPDKFAVRLSGPGSVESVASVRAMFELLWTSQLDRHGTANEEVPLTVTLEQAQDAVALATTLVHLAQQGGFTANGS